MGTGISCKKIKVSEQFRASIEQVYDYGFEMFGYFQAIRYKQIIQDSLSTLSDRYTIHPECRHLATKSRMYRNIILDAHLIIYRITDECIEILDIIHAASSISKIRSIRSIRL
ncbi:MAG: type II toxin-antitoxin system RelE/ParE family toxin [Dysgonamonadaceae bacterium]|jgi:plasmid stabilization system protein ParE|nr:type II toxin-antitoxin system RelE/ParE family toxin [Dysgonamonadaceae bacterium]